MGWVNNAAAQYTLCMKLSANQDQAGRVRKISPKPAFDPRTFQPVACCEGISYKSMGRNSILIKVSIPSIHAIHRTAKVKKQTHIISRTYYNI
jgi:hypothetical protein